MHNTNVAFTLVELSIVLVILGLLVGGVLSGQSLIHAAELRAVQREFTGYQTALGTFRDKYFALPGDMANAVSYWGAQAGATTEGYNATCAGLTTGATGIATCNGNGDGKTGGATNANSYEIHRAWQHLANAQMVEGQYIGIRYNGGGAGDVRDNRPGVNMPRSKFPNAGWTMESPGEWAISQPTVLFQNNYGTVLYLGAQKTSGLSENPVVRAEDAYNIDMKMDDGRPQSGKLVTYKYARNPQCVPSTNDSYTLSDTTAGCTLLFITGY